MGSLPTFGPAVLAFLVAFTGSLLSRRWRRVPAIWASVGAGAGWAGLVPMPWRWPEWSRSTLAFLVLPAVGFAVAELVRVRLRGRRIGVAAVCFAAWWLANAPMGRPQFWRVGFGGMMLAWLLGRVGAAEPRMAVGVALTAFFGLILGGATANWDWALAVMAVAAAGVWLGGRNGVFPPGLTMVGLLGAELGGGRVMRGSVGTSDLACLFAIGAPLLVPGVEGWLRRRLGSVAPILAVIVVAFGLSVVAWGVSRALRG